MPSNIDIQKVVHALGDSKLMNLDLKLREVVASPAAGLINSVANLEPWDLICYTWVTLIRRRPFNDLVLPVGQLISRRSRVWRAGMSIVRHRVSPLELLAGKGSLPSPARVRSSS
jgi:hypothetical protein